MTNTYWKLIFGAVAAVAAYLLVQQDVILEPAIKAALGAVTVALAVLNPNRAT